MIKSKYFRDAYDYFVPFGDADVISPPYVFNRGGTTMPATLARISPIVVTISVGTIIPV